MIGVKQLKSKSKKTVAENKWWFYLLLMVVVLVILPVVVPSSYFLHIMIMIFLFASLGEAWNIIGGYAGQLSLAHHAFFGIGAYTSTILYMKMNLSPWVGLLFGVILAVLFAFFMGFVSLRLKGIFFALVTLAFAQVLRIIADAWRGLTRGALGITIPSLGNSLLYFQFEKESPYYYIILAIMLMLIVLTRKLEKSKFGYCLMGIREEEIAASCLGVNTFWYKLLALMISAACTALLGTFYAQYMRIIHPTSVLDLSLIIQVLLVTLVGGGGTIIGPILGSFILVPVSEFTRGALGGGRFMGVHFMIYGAVLMGAVLFLPGGLVRHIEKLVLFLRKLRGSADKS